MQPLVSIIITAYNHEDYVGACLESMINQTYRNIELIVLNDGSKDRTHEVITAYEPKLAERFSKYTYIDKHNEGISVNFNKGIRMSSGDYIKTFASDDILLPQAIEHLVRFLEENSEFDVAYGDGYHILTKETDLTDFEFDEIQRFSNITELKSGYIYEHLLTMLPHMSTCTVLFRRKCFEEAGYYDESLSCEDMDLYLRYSREYQFGYIQQDIALHRIHGDNAGYNPAIMIPSLQKMLAKYDRIHFFRSLEERDQFIEILEWSQRVLEVIDYESRIPGKKVIVWGTGAYYQKYKGQVEHQLAYFADSNAAKTGTELDGKLIYLPEQLLEENKDEIFVCVMSMYYKEIYQWLEERGFTYRKHYY